MGIREAISSFEGVGLILHEVANSAAGGRALGVIVDGQRAEAPVTDDRFWRVRIAILELLRRHWVSGVDVDIVSGHIAYMCLLLRQLLAIFHCVYRFVR